MNHWPFFSCEPNVLDDLTFPIEFLFVFALRDIVKSYNISLEQLHVTAITFPRNSRQLENGEDYREKLKSVWIASDLKPLTNDEISGLSEENCWIEMPKRFHHARAQSHERILLIELLSGESVVEVYQDLWIRFRIGDTEEQIACSVPVGFCVYKTLDGRIF